MKHGADDRLGKCVRLLTKVSLSHFSIDIVAIWAIGLPQVLVDRNKGRGRHEGIIVKAAIFSNNCGVSILDAAVGSAITLAIKEGLPLVWKAYKNRRIEPKKAQQQYLLGQATWFHDRGIKLRELDGQLASRPLTDKFQLAILVSKLDRTDQQWAMKIADIDKLRELASGKATECEDNAAESTRLAEWIDTHSFW